MAAVEQRPVLADQLALDVEIGPDRAGRRQCRRRLMDDRCQHAVRREQAQPLQRFPFRRRAAMPGQAPVDVAATGEQALAGRRARGADPTGLPSAVIQA